MPVPASRIRTNRKRIQTLTSYSHLAGQLAGADTVAQAWGALDPTVKADTLVVVTATAGDDTFIYTNM